MKENAPDPPRPQAEATREPRRSRWQFSMRVFFLFMLLLAIGLAWAGVQTRRLLIYESVSARAAELDVWIGRNGEVWDVNSNEISDNEVRELVALLSDHEHVFDRIGMSLAHSPIGDSALQPLSRLQHLESLCLDNTKITDEGLAHLDGLGNLRALGLDSTKITDEGLARLAGLANLRALGLGMTDITDDGLVHLRELPELEKLDLTLTHVTDDGLPHLQTLEQLKLLELGGTEVTEVGVNTLSQSLPECVIHAGPFGP